MKKNTSKDIGPGETIGLSCFGALSLEPSLSSKVSSKHLLLLSYVALEKVSSRQALAQTFWPHLAGRYNQRGGRKDSSNLSVARTVLKSELGVDIEEQAQVAALECDVKRFEDALERGAFAEALALYRQGTFLEDIESKPRLNLSAELHTWLEEKRAYLAQRAQAALWHLAQDPHYREQARDYAEDLFRLNRGSRDLAYMTQLHTMLFQLDAPLQSAAQEVLDVLIEDCLEDLSPDALRLYLALSLQGTLNLAAAQVAADVSPSTGTACLEELRDYGLVSAANETLNYAVAAHYFEHHSQEKMTLLSGLRDHTPAEQAYSLYRAIYEMTQTFGGVGYWSQARTAYCCEAAALIRVYDFGAAADILEQFREAEYCNQQTPKSETRFLQAYALERLSRYKQGLEVLEKAEETPEIIALRAALLARTASFQEAKRLAKQVSTPQDTPQDTLQYSGPTLQRIGQAASPRMAWAKAMAFNTLGQVAYEENCLLEAEVYFEKTAVQWALAGRARRELGALMNRANVLEEMGHADPIRKLEARRVYEQVLERCDQDEVLRVRTLLNLGYLYEDAAQWEHAHRFYKQAHALSEEVRLAEQDVALCAALYNNLGYTQWKLGFADAHTNLNHALGLALQAGEHFWYAVALSNLALIEDDIGKFAAALDLFKQLGSVREVAHYSELYKEMLQNHLLRAHMADDRDGVRFLIQTFSSVCGVTYLSESRLDELVERFGGQPIETFQTMDQLFATAPGMELELMS